MSETRESLQHAIRSARQDGWTSIEFLAVARVLWFTEIREEKTRKEAESLP